MRRTASVAIHGTCANDVASMRLLAICVTASVTLASLRRSSGVNVLDVATTLAPMCTTAFSEFAVRTSGRKRQASLRFAHTVSLIGNVKFAGRLLLSVRNGHKAHGAVHARSIQLQSLEQQPLHDDPPRPHPQPRPARRTAAGRCVGSGQDVGASSLGCGHAAPLVVDKSAQCPTCQITVSADS